MNKMKVYDMNGQFIDNVEIPDGVKREHVLIELNNRGRYVRSQFSKSGKTLTHSYNRADWLKIQTYNNQPKKINLAMAAAHKEIIDVLSTETPSNATN